MRVVDQPERPGVRQEHFVQRRVAGAHEARDDHVPKIAARRLAPQDAHAPIISLRISCKDIFSKATRRTSQKAFIDAS